MNTPRTASYTAQPDRFVHERLPPRAQWPQLRYDLPELQWPDQLNLVERLMDGASQRGWADRPLLRSPQGQLSYAQARQRVDRIANQLIHGLGLVPGNRVLLRGGNSPDMALAWLAVVKAGLIAVATMPLLRAAELERIISKARPVAALCDARLLPDLLQARQALTSAEPDLLRHVLSFGQAQPTPDPQVPDLQQLAASQPDHFQPCPTGADDIALLAFTSGTTGTPKAVVHTHRDVLSACECWPRHVLKPSRDDIVTGSPPLAFTFGLGGLLLFPMWAGASVYYPDVPYRPDTMVQQMRDNGVTTCYTAPTFYRQMAPHAKAIGIPSLHTCVSAGEALPDATRQQWKDATGIEMLDGIGSTEMFHIFISSAGEQVRRGAIGQVVPGYQAKVVDEQGRELPRGQIGQLAVIGPTGCRYMDDERQQRYVPDGWNRPGDAFVQDADGYFHYQARDDDMIITAGYNVGGPEVEDCLLSHPAVAECGVIGKPDEERGMLIKAFIVLKPGHTPDEAMVKTLQEHVKRSIAPYKYPREISFVDTLPRTETGKLQRFRLRQSG